MDENVEIWKDIPGYEGYYQVSDLGRVKSMSRGIYNGHKIFTSKEKELKPRIISGDDSYQLIALYKNKIRKDIKVHQLVSMAFLDHTPNGNTLVINHIDGNKMNNRLSNLEIVTHRANCTTCFSRRKEGFSSKYPGVFWSKSNKKWASVIWDYKNRILLGTFDTEEEASMAYSIELIKITSKRIK